MPDATLLSRAFLRPRGKAAISDGQLFAPTLACPDSCSIGGSCNPNGLLFEQRRVNPATSIIGGSLEAS